MEAGEAGADALVLTAAQAAEELEAFVAWWSQLFVLPLIVATGAPMVAATALAAGADMILVPDAVPAGADAPAQLEALAALCTAPRG
jgi:2-methylisocitrate lyase-like PEP mutase family enzyme